MADAGPPEQQPGAPAELGELEPLEAHIVALRAQLVQHERMLRLATGAVLVAALVLLAASKAKVQVPR